MKDDGADKGETDSEGQHMGADLFVCLVTRHAPAALGLRVEDLARQGKGFPPTSPMHLPFSSRVSTCDPL